MGCAASSIDKEERVQVCKERKRLMKHLVGFRREFADSQLAYLRALKNTGVTLRQFTESDLLEPEDTAYCQVMPPSPPPPLPPSPPPPPPFSPDLRKVDDDKRKEVAEVESIDISEGDGDGSNPPPPPVPSSSWDYWDPFESLSSHHHSQKSEIVEQIEEENWAETQTEFGDDEKEEELSSNKAVSAITKKLQPAELVDDNSSMLSWYTKDTSDVPTVKWRSEKTLQGIIKELDDYFLKASAGEKEIAILMDFEKGDTMLPQNFKENKRKRSNSAKVFSALSWSWSSKSFQLTRDCGGSSSQEPCRPGAHCITLGKLYAAEQKLYKEVKEEEITKLEHEKRSMLLQKQKDENHDLTKIEKNQSSVESLETDIRRLQHSISETRSSILKLIDEELYPQLVSLTSGLVHVWKTMYESHQIQSHISQQLNHITDCHTLDVTTEFHHQATSQLETEVTSWYNSFCKLTRYQRDYVTTLYKWIQLTKCLVDHNEEKDSSSIVRRLCEEWQLVFERLPDKVASEAIKSFLSAIQSIVQQQVEEHNLHKKFDKLEKRLQKELLSLEEMERKHEGGLAAEDTNLNLSPRHPLSLKRAKTEGLKKQVETEKAKYLNSVQVSKTMTLTKLKTSLPIVFQALVGFSSSCVQALEAVHSPVKPDHCDADPSETRNIISPES